MNIECDQLCSSVFCVWKDHISNLGQEIPILTAIFHGSSQPHWALLKYYILFGHDILSSTLVLINFSL
jgi:hypothetical protein